VLTSPDAKGRSAAFRRNENGNRAVAGPGADHRNALNLALRNRRIRNQIDHVRADQRRGLWKLAITQAGFGAAGEGSGESAAREAPPWISSNQDHR
jgi:hypothetical protein